MATEKPLSYEDFKAIYSRVPRLSVDVVVVYKGGVVLVERALESYKGQWHLPGGTLHFGEKVAEAAMRFAKDEAGLLVSVGEILGYIEYHSEQKERGFGYTVGIVMQCEYLGGNMVANDEGSDIKSFKTLPTNMVVDQKNFMKSIGYTVG